MAPEKIAAQLSLAPFPELAVGQLYDQGVSPLDPRSLRDAKRKSGHQAKGSFKSQRDAVASAVVSK